ncbi:MAG: hypothetical protein ACEQSB_02560 [Undibacterium sp.]
MGGISKKKIKKQILLLLIAALFFQGLFQGTDYARADDGDGRDGPADGYATPVDTLVKTQSNKNNNSNTDAAPLPKQTVTPGTCLAWEVGCQIFQLIVEMLETFRNFLYRYLMSPAAVAFAWTVDPASMTGPSGTLNLPAVYALWQFIRDFFNLFFILILLFSAFATIFQVDSFNIRNIFKNILLVALFINFSFPITRLLIDAANVPMYYFINDVLGNGTTSGGMFAMSEMLAYSGTGAAVFTNVDGKDLAPVIMGIIFVFLFSISLFVLGLMMIVRLIALTMLLIFSPIGFAAALIPGFEKAGREWWENFWKYALFGPSAALMLMVSIKFMAAVAGSGVWTNMMNYASGATPDASSATFLAQVVFFCVPIIMIWFTIGMAGRSSLAGASVVVGLGYALPKAIGNYTKTKVVNTGKFVGKTAVNTVGGAARVVLPYDRLKGELAGVKEAMKGDGKMFGRQIIPKSLTPQARQEAAENKFAVGKGRVLREGGWSTAKAGADTELKKLEDERVQKAVKENAEKKIPAGKHIATLENKDGKATAFDKRVAALSLAQDGEIRTASQLTLALDSVKGSADEFNKVLDKAKPSAIGSMTSADNAKIIDVLNAKDDKGLSVFGERQNDLKQSYGSALKKENKIEYKIQLELDRARNAGPTQPGLESKVYKDVLKMGSKDLSKQSGLIQSTDVQYDQAGNVVRGDPFARAYFEELAKNNDAFEKILRSDELKEEDMKALLKVRDSVRSKTSPSEEVTQAGIVIPQSSKPRGENR